MADHRRPTGDAPAESSKDAGLPGDAERSFRRVVESIRDYAMFMLDAEGYIRTWNTGAELTKGYGASEIVGEHIERFYEPADRIAGKPRRLLEQARNTGRVEDEGWRVRKDGTRFWADVVITALRDEDGAIVGFAKVTRDLTARRAAEEALRQSEKRFRALIDGVKDYAIFLLDENGCVTTWNSGAERIKGYRADEILGEHFSRFYLPEDAKLRKWALALRVAASDGRYEEEGWRVRKDGTKFWANAILSVLHNEDGSIYGYTKITRDLTERRNDEQNRLRLAQAQEGIRMRDEFLSIASHELRTPLTALQLQLHGLRARVAPLDEALSQKLERSIRNGERLATLIDSLLDVSRISSGNFALEPVSFVLGEAVTAVVESFRPAASHSGNELVVDVQGDTSGTWDRVRVEQIVTNLLSNAIKYAPASQIDVRVATDGEAAVLTVRDRGPGIPEGSLDRIFERFERASSPAHYGGLGLGLYVTREIAEAHGGTVHVENAEDGGACFIVRLPSRRPFSLESESGT